MAMNKQRRTANLNNIVTYDTLKNVTLLADLTVEGLTGAGFVKADANGLLSVDTGAYLPMPSQTGNGGKYLTTDGVNLSWGTVSTANIYNSNGTLTANRTISAGGFTLTINPLTTFSGAATAASSEAIAHKFTPTLTAIANSDRLIGLDILPTFVPGAFTGVGRWGTRTRSLWINHDTWNALSVTPALYVGDKDAAAFYVHPGIGATDTTELFMRGNNPGLGLWFFSIKANYNVTISSGQYVENMYFNMGSTNAMTIKNTGNVIIGGSTDSATYKLDVQGALRSTGNAIFNDISIGQTGGNRFISWGLNDLTISVGTTTLTTIATLYSGGVTIPNLLTAGGGTTIGAGSEISGYSRKLTFSVGVNHVPTHVLISQGDAAYGGFNTQPGNIWIYPGKNTTNNIFGNIVLLHDNTDKRGNLLIGGTTDNSSAIVNIQSTTQGFLGPRMTTVNRNAITTPATGLQIYNTTTNTNDLYNGVSWNSLLTNANVATFDGGELFMLRNSFGTAYNGAIVIAQNNAKTSGYAIGNIIVNSRSTFTNLTGSYNTLIGANAGAALTSGSYNIMVGALAGLNVTASGQNVYIGHQSSGTASDKTVIQITAGSQSYVDGVAADMYPTTQNYAFIGGGYYANEQIQHFYFGAAPLLRDAAYPNSNKDVFFYAPSASQVTDRAGGNFTINAGRGTGTGTPGDVIISTATPTSTGTTLQTLTQRVWIKGNNGNVGIGASPNASYKLDVGGQGRFTECLFITGGQSEGALNVTNGNSSGFSTVIINRGDVTNSFGNIAFTDRKTGALNRGFSIGIGMSGDPTWAAGDFLFGYYTGTGGYIQSARIYNATGNWGIGSATTDIASAILHVTSTTKGFLPPRMSTTQKTSITTPASGLIVYDTSTNVLNYYDGVTWVGAGAGVSTNLYTADGTLSGDRYINGNSKNLHINDINTLRVSVGVVATNDVALFEAIEPNIAIKATGATNGAALFLMPSAGYNGAIHNRTGAGIEFYVGATPSVNMVLQSTGQFRLNSYTSSSSFTGTAAGYLAFDSSGNIITASSAGNIYNENGTLTGNRVVSAGGFSLTLNPQTAVVTTLNAVASTSTTALVGQNTITYASGFSSSSVGSIYGAIGGINLQTFNGSATFAQANLAANALVNSIDFSTTGSTITMTQATGIRAMSGTLSQVQYQGTNSGTITHVAVHQVLGLYRPSSATGTLTINKVYGLLVNALDDYGATGFTLGGLGGANRWGIYQNGASDNNYFKGKVIIGSTDTVGVSPLNVKNLPTSSSGLASGDVWNNGGVLNIV